MSKKNTRLLIIRHGESIANAQKIYLGHMDWDLSQRGKQQAEETANFLRNEKISAIYSSDLIRAYNTALPNAKIHNIEIIKSKELREIFLGEWEGLRISELETIYEKEFNSGWRENFGVFKVPGGDKVSDVGNRIYNEIMRIAKLHRGQTVIVACHAAAIRSFWGMITNTPWADLAAKIPFPHNASVSVVEYDGENLIPIEYSVHHFLSE